MFSANQESAIRVLNAVAAGTSAQTSSVIDTAGYDGVKIYTGFGAITTGAVTSVKLQQSSDDGVADGYSDIEGSSITVNDDDDNQFVVHDLYRPQKRYIKVVISRATQNAVIDGVLAVRYSPKKLPATNDSATIVALESYASPAEGTA